MALTRGAYLPTLVHAWATQGEERRWQSVSGSLVVLDISGFTRLTERLAAKGRAGAEELSDILDAVFGALVVEALDEGCDLLKWGGDAVLLCALGEDAPLRASRAAHRMRSSLNRVGHVRSSVGRVVLRASTGVVTGELHFALVGDPAIHRELVVMGPAATAVTLLEGAAGADQILLDARTAEALPAQVLGEPVGPGRLLRALPGAPRPPGALRAQGAAAGPEGHGGTDNGEEPLSDPGRYLPTQLRAHLAQRMHEPEHRVAAVAFIRFGGTDSVLAADGIDALAGAADELVRNVQDATSRHGVAFHESDIDVDGGKIMLVAGAPQSSGDDVDHLLAAVRLVVDRAGRLPVRAGIAQGRVFAGDLGPVLRRTYSVKGGAVNLAARLAARAQPGTVCAPAELLTHSRVSWEVDERIALRLKGIAEPVATVVLGHATSQAVESAETAMVGRDAELERLRESLDRLGEGHGGMVTILGEPGMGKTRLAAELVSEADDFRVVTAECGHSGSASPYVSVRALLAGALGLHAGIDASTGLERALTLVRQTAPELVEQVWMLGLVFDAGVRGSAAVDEEFRSETLRRLVTAVLRGALTTPTVLLVEDAHLMDGDSTRAMEHLVSRCDDMPWLVVTTRRRDGAGWVTGGEVMELGPLAANAAASMTEMVTPDRPLPPATARALVERSGGHPLFLRELVLAASRGDEVGEMPLSVEELVAVQIDALDALPRALLRRAAVLGNTFPHSLLKEVVADLPGAGDRPLRPQLDELASFLEPKGSRKWRFRHAVHREAAYAGLPMKVRSRLHAHVGEVLSRSARTVARRPEVLADHFFAAGDYGRAWECARRAGLKATAQAAPEAAAHAYAQAAESAARAGTVPTAQRAADLESWGDALFLCGRSAESDRAYGQARRLLHDRPVESAALALKSAKVAQRQGRYPVALRRTTVGLRLLEDHQGADGVATRARLLARRSVIQMSQGRYTEAGACATQAVRLAEQAGQDDALAQAHLVLHGVEVFTGASSETDHGQLALRIYEGLGDRSGQAHSHNNIAMRLLLKGDWPAALEQFRRAAAGFEAVGDAANAANAAYNSADLLNRQGRSAQALEVLAGVTRVARAVDDEELVALAVREEGRAHVRDGRALEGMRLLEESRAMFHELHEPHEVCDTDIAIAEAHVLAGRSARAVEAADAALETADRLGAVTLRPSALRVRASALAELGQRDLATQAVAEGLRASAAPELAHERGFLLAVAAHLDGGPNGAKDSTHDNARNGSQDGSSARTALDTLGVVRPPLPWHHGSGHEGQG
jgi:class 3 adenylate cyclase/tetratricopeptide (TPR) repeat protein